MNTPPFAVSVVNEQAGTVTVVAHGELDLASAPHLNRLVAAQRAAGLHVRLDFTHLEFIDSSGIRSVMDLVADAKVNGWNLSMRPQMQRPVRRVFELTDLLPELPIVDE
jgi:anti-anti-sigma factor